MLNQTNHIYLSVADRKSLLERALYTNPYWYLLDFPVIAGGDITTQYQQRAEINEDFILTGLIGNFGDVFVDTGSLFNIDIFTQLRLTSILNFSQGLLPSPFSLYEARFDATLPNQVFDDRQVEIMPFLVKRNDKIIAEIQNVSAKSSDSSAKICLSGFNLNDYRYIGTQEQSLINDSLNQKIHYEYFSFEITANGFQEVLVENDKIPRLIVAFGATNSEQDKTLISIADVQIEDVDKRTQFTNRAIPLEFLAPRLTCLLDSHLYYLPIEYYFNPYGVLKFSVDNTFQLPAPPVQGFTFHILTRTV